MQTAEETSLVAMAIMQPVLPHPLGSHLFQLGCAQTESTRLAVALKFAVLSKIIHFYVSNLHHVLFPLVNLTFQFSLYCKKYIIHL